MHSKTTFRKIFLAIVWLSLALGCAEPGDFGDDGGLSTGGTGTSDGRALLGPVIAARVELFTLADRTHPICVTETASSTDLSRAGLISLPENCRIDPDTLYLIAISGGLDIDADDNNVIDTEYTPVEGTFHAFLSGQLIQENSWQVTAISEAMYQSVQALLDLGYTEEQIIAHLEAVVPEILTQDLNGDGEINGNDALVYDANINLNVLHTDGNVRAIINEIHTAKNTSKTDLTLPPGISGHLDTLAAATRVYPAAGDIVLVSTSTALLAVDVSEPAAPTIVAALPLGWIYDLVVIDNYAYIAQGPAGLTIAELRYDPEDETSPPALLKISNGKDNLAIGSVYRLDVVAGELYYCDAPGISRFTIGRISTNNPHLPQASAIANLNSPEPSIMSACNVQSAGDKIYASLSSSNLETSYTYITEIQDGVATLLSSIENEDDNSFVVDIEILNNRVYLATGFVDLVNSDPSDDGFDQELLVFNVDDPSNPIRIEVSDTFMPLTVDASAGKLLSWQDGTLDLIDPVTLDILGSVAIAGIETDGDRMVDVAHSIAEAYISLRVKEVPPETVVEILDRAFNFKSRLRSANGYSYLAAGIYGLLIIPTPVP